MNSRNEKFSLLVWPLTWALRTSSITIATVGLFILEDEPASAIAANLFGGFAIATIFLIWGLLRIRHAAKI